MIVAKRAQGWLTWLGEVIRALVTDPVLLAPALVIIVLAVGAAYLAWRFV